MQISALFFAQHVTLFVKHVLIQPIAHHASQTTFFISTIATLIAKPLMQPTFHIKVNACSVNQCAPAAFLLLTNVFLALLLHICTIQPLLLVLSIVLTPIMPMALSVSVVVILASPAIQSTTLVLHVQTT